MQNARRYSNLMALSDALSTISFKRGLVNKAVIAFWLAEAHATSYRVSELKHIFGDFFCEDMVDVSSI